MEVPGRPAAGEAEEERGDFATGDESARACRFLDTREFGVWGCVEVRGEGEKK